VGENVPVEDPEFLFCTGKDCKHSYHDVVMDPREREFRKFITDDYGQDPDSDSCLYDAADMLNAFAAGYQYCVDRVEGVKE
jgi:hypothetical protein